jgi:hypothetical protein
MITREMLLGALPPYEDQWIMIHDSQGVNDIVIEVLESHKEFAPHYNSIALYFDDVSTEKVCSNIYDFLKKNIRYVEETEADQTTALPTGILLRSQGDCKHYSGFAGGILDAIKRVTGKNIKWCYRFASYDFFNKTPHHVFVVVKKGSDEIWIDPTPKANEMQPVWQIDKKITVSPMALRRNIAGFGNELILSNGQLGALADEKVTMVIDNGHLGLSKYPEDPGFGIISVISTRWSDLANQINNEIRRVGKSHTVNGEFVKWIFTQNIKSWNFYEPNGVAIGFNASNMLPANYPRFVVTPDGRLTFDRDQKLTSASPEIHYMVAWAQSLVNQYQTRPYPVKPAHIIEFSEEFTGNPNNPAANLFNEPRGESIFKQVGDFLEDAFAFVKEGILKIVGSIPRNAFLALVGINAFNFAGSMWNKIQAGQWDKMANKWKSVGGNPDKLRGTIEDGKDKKAIMGYVQLENVIGVEPTSAGAAGLLAAAAPIIAAMLAFLDKEGKITEVLSATKSFLQAKYPNIDLTAYGFLDKNTGKEIEFVVDPRDDENLGGGNDDMPGGSFLSNPLMIAGLAGGVTYFLTNKKGQKKNFTTPALVAALTYFLLPRARVPNAGYPGTSSQNLLTYSGTY